MDKSPIQRDHGTASLPDVISVGEIVERPARARSIRARCGPTNSTARALCANAVGCLAFYAVAWMRLFEEAEGSLALVEEHHDLESQRVRWL